MSMTPDPVPLGGRSSRRLREGATTNRLVYLVKGLPGGWGCQRIWNGCAVGGTDCLEGVALVGHGLPSDDLAGRPLMEAFGRAIVGFLPVASPGDCCFCHCSFPFFPLGVKAKVLAIHNRLVVMLHVLQNRLTHPVGSVRLR